jgi:hypothetical protein
LEEKPTPPPAVRDVNQNAPEAAYEGLTQRHTPT